MKWQEFIEENPEGMLGKPVIRGTRLTVECILEKLGNGAQVSELLESYPFLRAEHIQAAQSFAAAYLAMDRTIFFDHTRPGA